MIYSVNVLSDIGSPREK